MHMPSGAVLGGVPKFKIRDGLAKWTRPSRPFFFTPGTDARDVKWTRPFWIVKRDVKGRKWTRPFSIFKRDVQGRKLRPTYALCYASISCFWPTFRPSFLTYFDLVWPKLTEVRKTEDSQKTQLKYILLITFKTKMYTKLKRFCEQKLKRDVTSIEILDFRDA